LANLAKTFKFLHSEDYDCKPEFDKEFEQLQEELNQKLREGIENVFLSLCII
jgi:hypothetical protein